MSFVQDWLGSKSSDTPSDTSSNSGSSGVGKMVISALGDYYIRKKLAKQQTEQYNNYLGQVGKAQTAAQWSPADREKFRQAVMGQIGDQVVAAQRQGAGTLAGAGRGGGSYGKAADTIRREGNKLAAQTLIPTYGPSTIPVPSLDVYKGLADAGDPQASWLQDVLSTIGKIGAQQYAQYNTKKNLA